MLPYDCHLCTNDSLLSTRKTQNVIMARVSIMKSLISHLGHQARLIPTNFALLSKFTMKGARLVIFRIFPAPIFVSMDLLFTLESSRSSFNRVDVQLSAGPLLVEHLVTSLGRVSSVHTLVRMLNSRHLSSPATVSFARPFVYPWTSVITPLSSQKKNGKPLKLVK